MVQDILPSVTVLLGSPVKHSVIWLHGLGADGHDFESVVPMLGLDPSLGLRFVFPHAPQIAVTLNGGMVMPAWYDITDIDLVRRHDEDGIRRSAEQVVALIEREEERGVPAERLVLAGFSQGAAIALHVALRLDKKLAGILALSTYLLLEASLEEERSLVNLETPIFQAHGSEDPMIPQERGEACRDKLSALGYSVSWHSYPMQHQVCPEEIEEIGRFLTACFATCVD